MHNKFYEITADPKLLTSDWIVEQPILPESGDYSRVVFGVYGKIYFVDGPKDALSEDDLENIWNLCNFEPAQIELEPVQTANNIYTHACFDYANRMVFVPMERGLRGAINDDIFIRKHYDITIGWYVNNHHRARNHKDEWKYESRQEVLAYYRKHPFLVPDRTY